LWQALGASDAATANRALAGQAAAPTQALPLFRERLPPLGQELDRAQLGRWIAQLDDESFQVRERATRELAMAGEDAADALRHALDNGPSAETKRRVEDLLSRLKTSSDSRRLRFLRAIEALERIGTPPAKELLRELAGKPMSIELREEVQASLRRLGDKP
jgi:HEAT repeat protein